MLAGVARTFLTLGCTSFGGPAAHVGYLRNELVEKRRWIDDAHYAELVALCQFLPGPASSQLVFALGKHRAGLAGAMVASACFTLPSALLMIGFAYAVAELGDLRDAGWLHGLKLAAVAVVAHAVWGMGRRLCPDLPRIAIGLAAATGLLLAPHAGAQLAALAGGAVLGWLIYRRTLTSPEAAAPPPSGHRLAAAALIVFGVLLVALPALAIATRERHVEQFDSFYRAGALVFGGGHVVLPLLRSEVVPPGWLDEDRFLAGYGAAQALPGPLFTFAAYLGTAMTGGTHAWAGGVLCLVAIFLPAWLLIGGALPFWNRLRRTSWAPAALAGANAAVVGVLLAALYDPVIVEGVHTPYDGVAALVAVAALTWWRLPVWALAPAFAALGQWVLPG